MAGKLRYWKEKDGRFWARMAVPGPVKEIIGRSEIIEPLGGDRREAIKKHPAAVARLRAQIAEAEGALRGEPKAIQTRDPITTADSARAVWQRYTTAIEADEAARASYASTEEIAAAMNALEDRVGSGELSEPYAEPAVTLPAGYASAYGETSDEEQRQVAELVAELGGPIVGGPQTAAEHPNNKKLALVAAALDYLRLKDARSIDSYTREARLTALKRELVAGETHQVEHEIDAYLDRLNLSAERGSAERAVLAKQMMRAEIEALQRTLERDNGNYGGKPSDPIVRPPAPEHAADPVSLSKLWTDYLASRTQVGFIKDGGKRQEPVIRNLRTFLKHNDARRVTKKDLLAWRDYLVNEAKLSAKTVSDIYLSTVRSIFAWAHENERLPENVAATVRQPKPRTVRSRERGYTDAEALVVLRASRSHVPKPNQFGYVRETAHMTAAKRWAPILCAFSGARISEITQLRKEDFREENGRWIMRITPDAGTVKAGGWRDVPLHRQIVELGFMDFVLQEKDGPLFHGATDPAEYATAAASVSDELAKWLRRSNIAPDGVQPNHAWRHRLKTSGRELGLSDRVIDAIQGHAGRTAGDNYGDVTVSAKVKVIDMLPNYQLD